MSSGKSGNLFPNIVKDFITPGPKMSKRIAEKKRGRQIIFFTP